MAKDNARKNSVNIEDDDSDDDSDDDDDDLETAIDDKKLQQP